MSAAIWGIYLAQPVVGVGGLMVLAGWRPQSTEGWIGLLVFGWFSGAALFAIASMIYGMATMGKKDSAANWWP